MRDWTEQLKEIEAQLEQQNAELGQAFSILQSLGDSVELSVPQAVLDELEDSCATPTADTNAVRMGIRA